MGLSKPQDLYFVTQDGNVKRGGGAQNLAPGQVAIVDLSKSPTRLGAAVVDNFATVSKASKLEFRLGKPKVGVSKSLDNMDYASLPFTLEDVKSLKVDAPKKEGIKVDDMIIGFNGKDGSEIVLENGDNEAFQLTLTGKAMSYLGYREGKATVQFQIEAPNTGDFTMQEIIEDAVERLKNSNDLIGQAKLTDFVDIIVVNSENLSTIPGAVPQKFFNLVVRDNGRHTDLAAVQAKYDFLVQRTDFTGEVSTYTTVAATAPDDFVVTFADKLKGCEDCPTGYDLVEGGFIYSMTMEDDGVDLTLTVEDVPNFVATTAKKLGNDDGVGTYSFVASQKLTDDEIETFLETEGPEATARFTFVGEVSDICSNTETQEFTWEEGETCNATEETYTITIADDECGDNRLAEIQAAYPDLTITVASDPAPAACMTTYETTVLTNVVCDECDPVFRELMSSEAPEDFHFSSWEKEEKTYSEDAKMGIRFRAKPTILSGSDEYMDDMDFVYESPRLTLVGGGIMDRVNESYKYGTQDRFPVKILQLYEPPRNYGGNLRYVETMSRAYFEGTRRHKGNNYAKYAMGEETRFKGTSQYVDYALTIHRRRYTQGWSDKVDEGRTYHFYAEVGRHKELEQLLNDLAAAAGVSTVQAYAL